MTVQDIRIRITQADLQRLDAEDKWIEVEDGEIVENDKNMTFLHAIVIQNLFRILDPFVTLHKLGTVYMDGVRYILAGTKEDIQRARKPDFSFIRTGRIPADFDWSGDFEGAPNLAVEVASPEQTNPLLMGKIARYLQAGSEEAWLLYPLQTTLYQFRHDAAEPVLYRDSDLVDTSHLFPGLTLSLSDIFKKQA